MKRDKPDKYSAARRHIGIGLRAEVPPKLLPQYQAYLAGFDFGFRAKRGRDK